MRSWMSTPLKPERSSTRGIVEIARYADGLIVALCFARFFFGSEPPEPGHLIVAMVAVPIWMELLGYFGAYNSHRLDTPDRIVRPVLSSSFFGTLLITPPAALLSGAAGLGRVFFTVTATTAVLSTLKLSIRLVLRQMRRRGMDLRYVCVVGDGPLAERLAAEFSQHSEWGLRLSLVAEGAEAGRRYQRPDGTVLSASSLSDALREEVVDEVWLRTSREGIWSERQLISDCEHYGLLMRALMSDPNGNEEGEPLTALASLDIAQGLGVGEGRKPDPLAAGSKRAMDLVLGTILLVASLPILFAAAVLVKLSSPGPVFFKQLRVGLRGRRFTIFKLRTMIDGAEAYQPKLMDRSVTGGPIFKDPMDWRVTPIGRLLRKFSIDELPQLFNVLLGNMSLVGPRPLPVSEAVSLPPAYWKRFSVKPGITCLWQVNGRSTINYERWMNYDLQYVDNRSFWLDMRLIAKTIPVVLSGRGAC